LSEEPRFKIAVTCILRNREGKYLIQKRDKTEAHGAGMWTVAGGGVEEIDWRGQKTPYSFPLWYGVGFNAIQREVKEETNLDLHSAKYLCDGVFIHAKGFPVFLISYYSEDFSGEVKSDTEFQWVTYDEVANFNLIVDIKQEIRDVEKCLLLMKNQRRRLIKIVER
jgi:8-oxo-dGTP pyrophosphatase MutT (NUDIX family)